ncbi:hydrolase [Actinokineospora globicatena]|nr:hydrolase [Actinokineospora globicatena]
MRLAAAMADVVRVGAVQFEHRDGDKAYNLGQVRRFAGAAADAGARVVVCPEMCLVGYWHLRRRTRQELWDLAEPSDGPLVAALRDLAGELGIGVGAGFLESAGERLFNSYAVCLPDGVVHVHRKLHAFEHEAISSGSGYTVFDTPWARMAVLICYDNNLVENVRACALAGATVLLAPHQTGGTHSRSPHGMKPIPLSVWENRHNDPRAVEDAFRGANGREWLMRWLPSRAHDNGLFVVFANGVGRDDDEVRTGNAMVIDPYGRVVAETWAAGDELVLADLDLNLVPLSTGRRWLAARRPELYGPLVERLGTERDPRTARFSPDPVDW